MRVTVGIVLLGLFAQAFGSWVQLESQVPVHDAATSSWVKRERASDIDIISLTVALRVDQERLAGLEQIFWEVSDPDHVRYGQHLNMDEVTKLLAVPASRVEVVRSHFMNTGATEAVVSPNRDMITVTMPASAAEKSLQTTLHIFEHTAKKNLRIIRASSGYSLPVGVAEHVTMVGDLLQFPAVRLNPSLGAVQGSGAWSNDCDASACKGLVTPGVLAQRYKLPTTTENTAKGNSMAVAEFQGQFYKPSDLSSFSSKCHRDVKVDVQVGDEQNSAGVEAELDIEYIKSVAPEVPLTVVYDSQYSLLAWANQINSMTNAPLVHSVSYGNDEKQQSSTEYMFTCNTAFMKAGVRGMSILFASGDQGVCGREGCGFWRRRFKPDFPGGSPYITVVGGTDFEGANIGAETAWSASGGGFSDTFAMPAYQKAAVESYKGRSDAKLPPQKYWNATGRGYPDVAALGGQKTPYCVAASGRFEGVAGTSASCPVVAGVFAKLNGVRLASGKSPLGFLNPFIYKNPSGFQDVQSGRNDAGTSYGFSAVKGWDAATGFGTPDYEALSKLVMESGVQSVVV